MNVMTNTIGREGLVRTLVDHSDRGTAVALIAGPGMGKTSVFERYIQTTYKQWERIPKKLKIVPVYIQLGQIPNNKKLSPHEFWAHLLTTILQEVTHPRVFISGKPQSFPIPKFLAKEDPFKIFDEALTHVVQKISGTAMWCRYRFIFDQSDLLFHPVYSPVTQKLLGVIKQNELASPYGVTFIGGRRLYEQSLRKKSLFHFLRRVPMACFNESDIFQYLQKRMPNISQETMQQVQHFSGGHPTVLEKLVQALAETTEDFDAALRQVATTIEPLFKLIWQEFDLGRGINYRGTYSAPEHAVMLYLIEQKKEVPVRILEKELGLKRLHDIIEFLCYVGVATKVLQNDKTLIRASFHLWNQWYLWRIRF